MADDRVDLFALLAQAVGQHDLAGPDVDAPEDTLHLGRRIAVEQARIGIGVPQLILVEQLLSSCSIFR